MVGSGLLLGGQQAQRRSFAIVARLFSLRRVFDLRYVQGSKIVSMDAHTKQQGAGVGLHHPCQRGRNHGGGRIMAAASHRASDWQA